MIEAKLVKVYVGENNTTPEKLTRINFSETKPIFDQLLDNGIFLSAINRFIDDAHAAAKKQELVIIESNHENDIQDIFYRDQLKEAIMIGSLLTIKFLTDNGKIQ